VPVRARRAKARECLPSCRDLASRNPQTEPARTFYCEHSFAHRFAFSRPVPRVRRCFRASFWLAPCVPNRPCDLPESKTRDASNRLLPPERFTCTRTSCVPGSLRDFHRVDPHGVLGSEWMTGGPDASRHPRTLRRIDAGHTLPYCLGLACVPSPVRKAPSVGVVFPRRQPIDRASDTSVASSSSPLWGPLRDGTIRSAFASPSRRWLLRASRLSRVRKPPRSP